MTGPWRSPPGWPPGRPRRCVTPSTRSTTGCGRQAPPSTPPWPWSSSASPARTSRKASARCGRSAGRSSPDVAVAELDADAGTDRPGGLGDGVFPGALAAAAHHEQIAVTDLVAEHLAAGAPAQQQGAGRTERDDRDHGVIRRAAADRVAVPGHAVAPVAIQAQARGGE